MELVSVHYSSTEFSSILGAGTGEHGVGVGKKEYLPAELGEGTVELMRTVKKAIDPMNLFNPGKVRDMYAVPQIYCLITVRSTALSRCTAVRWRAGKGTLRPMKRAYIRCRCQVY